MIVPSTQGPPTFYPLLAEDTLEAGPANGFTEEDAIRWCARHNKYTILLLRNQNGTIAEKKRYYPVSLNHNCRDPLIRPPSVHSHWIAIYEPFLHTVSNSTHQSKALCQGRLFLVNPLQDPLVQRVHNVVSLTNSGSTWENALRMCEEGELLKQFANEPNIAQLLGAYLYLSPHDAFRFVLVMKNCELGNLEDALNRGLLPSQPLKKLQLGWLRGLTAIHKKNIAHQNIHPKNLLIYENFTGAVGGLGSAGSCCYSSSATRKKIDFSPCYTSPEDAVARLRNPAEQEPNQASKKPREEQNRLFWDFASPKSDSWAMGIVYCHLLSEEKQPKKLLQSIFDCPDCITLYSRLAYFFTENKLALPSDPSDLFPEPTDKDSFEHTEGIA